MKKFILLIALGLFFSCSESEIEVEEPVTQYFLSLREDCSIDTYEYFQVEEEIFNMIVNNTEKCKDWVSVEDVAGNLHEGFLAGNRVTTQN